MASGATTAAEYSGRHLTGTDGWFVKPGDRTEVLLTKGRLIGQLSAIEGMVEALSLQYSFPLALTKKAALETRQKEKLGRG